MSKGDIYEKIDAGIRACDEGIALCERILGEIPLKASPFVPDGDVLVIYGRNPGDQPRIIRFEKVCDPSNWNVAPAPRVPDEG